MALLNISFGPLLYAIINILFGIFVLAFPKFLRYVVGAYFILSGILALVFL